jgi:GNAT superfamily N-acetyltransferase
MVSQDHFGDATEETLSGRALRAYGCAMGERPALFLGLLADQPELIAAVGALRWRASGCTGTAGPWIEATARDTGRDGLPATLVAMDLDGDVVGAVTLECIGTTPRVVHLVVRPGERRCGVGRLIVSAAEDLARAHGHHRMSVARDDDADFYRHCGWADGDDASQLVKELEPAG